MSSLTSVLRAESLLATVHQRRVLAFRPSTRSSSRVVMRAEGAASSNDPPITFTRIPAIQFSKDTENISDVFAFSGPLAERLNGRVAMWSFVAIALREYSAHVPALQQFGEDWGSVILLALLLTSASLAPKFASSTSLRDLHAAATSENLPDGFVKPFNEGLEILVGRTAMLGSLGLVVAEVFKGDAIF